jgi:hypothetical protein
VLALPGLVYIQEQVKAKNNMFNAQPFPTVSTGFSSGGSAMLPAVSNVGEIRKMSPIDTMKEVFIDIRDGIDNLSSTFSEKISGLNKY